MQRKYKTVYSTKPDFVPDKAEKSEPVTPAPERQNLKVRLDKKHRRGKAVTLISGFAGSTEDLKELGKTLKSRCGMGDAVGEPFGTRFGKHTYKVPSLLGAQSKRSYEGSAAILVTCLLAVSVGIFLSPQLQAAKQNFILVPVLALICTVLEAVSPRGWDNATMQIIPSYLAKCWFLFLIFHIWPSL